MELECEGREYELLFGSDVIHNGVYLELDDLAADSETILWAFRSDETGRLTFSAFREDIPWLLVDAFVTAVREELVNRPLDPNGVEQR